MARCAIVPRGSRFLRAKPRAISPAEVVDVVLGACNAQECVVALNGETLGRVETSRHRYRHCRGLAGAGWTRNKLAADRQGVGARHARPRYRHRRHRLSRSIPAVWTPQINDVWDFKISMVAPEGGVKGTGGPGSTRICRSGSTKSASGQARRDRKPAPISLFAWGREAQTCRRRGG